jgi:site-specific recombinase XerD
MGLTEWQGVGWEKASMSVHKVTTPAGTTRYAVRWREFGSNRSRNFDVRRDAAAYDREIRRLRQAGEFDEHVRAETLTVRDYATDWWARHNPGLASSSRAMYAHQLLKRILPEWGDWRLRTVKPADVERWIAVMHDQHVGDATILKALTVFQAMFGAAVRDRLVPVNPVQQARKPRQHRDREPVLITPAQVEQIRARLTSDRDRTLVSVLAYCGLRPESEALPLRWRHVRDHTLLITATKTGVERSVPLLDAVRSDLDHWRHMSDHGDDMLVFPSNTGREWAPHDWRNWRRRVFAPAAHAAGLPEQVRPRDLRTSLASLLVHEGRSIVEVAALLGHSPTTLVRDYARILGDADPSARRPADVVVAEARQHINDGKNT